MKIACISDTHGYHDQISIPKCDMIICSGDISFQGTKKQVEDFLTWYQDLDIKYKIFIAGNHDFLFEKRPKEARTLLNDYNDIIYLQDSEIIIEGIKIWGSPWQPWFYNWAFNFPKNNLKVANSKWKEIPEDTDILVTHGPPFGILDKVKYDNKSVGCPELRERIEFIKPKAHIFGHIHEQSGIFDNNPIGTLFVNASICTLNYKPTGPVKLNPVRLIEIT